jgi:hypothetical protein
MSCDNDTIYIKAGYTLRHPLRREERASAGKKVMFLERLGPPRKA